MTTFVRFVAAPRRRQGPRRSSNIMEITSFGILVMEFRQRKVNEDFLNSKPCYASRSCLIRVVNAIPLEQFGANFTEDISCEKIPNDDLCRLHCANTGLLINQIKHSLLAA